MKDLKIFDNFLPDPEAYRRVALDREFRTYDFETGQPGGQSETYHGIATPTPNIVPARLVEMFPAVTPTLSFFRRSPAGQVEPQWIHTDVGMGDWTALLYLNPDPPAWDGTVFWRYLPTGATESAVPDERSEEGRRPNPEIWKLWRRISARFNRLIMFPSTYFHSRAIFANWSAGDDARLTQVVFGTGELS